MSPQTIAQNKLLKKAFTHQRAADIDAMQVPEHLPTYAESISENAVCCMHLAGAEVRPGGLMVVGQANGSTSMKLHGVISCLRLHPVTSDELQKERDLVLF
jgi:hypothetical protein